MAVDTNLQNSEESLQRNTKNKQNFNLKKSEGPILFKQDTSLQSYTGPIIKIFALKAKNISGIMCHN